VNRRSGGLLVSLAVAATWLAAGCTSGSKSGDSSQSSPDSSRRINTPAGVSTVTHVRTGMLPAGSIPYDNLTLPIVSHTGRYIATQIGAPPKWNSILAAEGAQPPAASSIQVYHIHAADQPLQPPPPTPHCSIDQPWLLGRSGNDRSFLVEAPQDDGSRWIGAVDWTTCNVTWLVNDGSVNAFATQNEFGELAFSRRAPGSSRFDLVVKQGSQEWSLSSPDASWLMPTWSPRGDALFVIRLSDSGQLSLLYGSSASRAAFQQSAQTLSLTNRANVQTAYQVMAGTASRSTGDSRASTEQLIFYHPGQSRAALWQPLTASSRRLYTLADHSYAAVMDDEEFAIVATDEALIRQAALDPTKRPAELAAGAMVPRRVDDPNWQFLLLSPVEGRIGLTFMRLMPPE